MARAPNIPAGEGAELKLVDVKDDPWPSRGESDGWMGFGAWRRGGLRRASKDKKTSRIQTPEARSNTMIRGA